MNAMKKIRLMIIGMLIMMTTAGCGLLNSIEAESGGSDDGTKYNAYIALSNDINGGFFDAILSNYLNTFGIEKEMYVSERFNGFSTTPFSQAFIDAANENLALASEEPSYGETDEAVKRLIPITILLMEANNDIQNYYSAKSYVDDQFAKGHELHANIISLYEKYVIEAEQFMETFGVISEQHRLEDLERMKEEDQLIRYYAMSTVISAQDIQEAFSEKGLGNDRVIEFDQKEYEVLYNKLSDDIAKYLEYSKDKERSKKEKWANLELFSMSMEGVKVTATDIKEILRTGDTEINSDTAGKVTTGGSNAILNTFDRKVSSLVDSYNTSINMKVTN